MPSCMTNPSLLPQVCSPTTGVLSFGTFPRALVRNLLRTAGHGLKRSELTEIRKTLLSPGICMSGGEQDN